MTSGQRLLSLILLTQSLGLQASSLTPLPSSYGALLYDIHFSAGPGSSATISPGQWVPDLSTFNSLALEKNLITRMYPYSADIEIACTDPNNVSTCTISPGYTTGSASVSAYKSAFSSAQVLPIVDIAFNLKDFNNALLKTNTTLADNVAQALVTEICADPNAAGVLFDLETSGGLSNPGLFELYRKVSTLFSVAPCKNSTYVNGRYIGIYLTPTVANNDWAQAQAMFAGRNNGFLAIPLYDVKGFTPTPTPDPLSSYTGYVTSALGHAKTYAMQYKVPYTIIVPAAASFGTFQDYGIYNASEPAPTYFQLITDYSSNATQLAFVQGARAAACANQNPYFMGIDYWAWNQYVNPGQNSDNTYQLTMPNVPNTDTVGYLQKYASCQ
ncbi:MAG: hypothetical protein NTW08_08130 [Gammaproteobacteria bacterium]|nr:hypothetical protein [Gammaproteobacteria bacterium]